MNYNEFCTNKCTASTIGKNIKYNIQYWVGKTKYLLSYWLGSKYHEDGSEFWDVRIFKNKKEMNLFIKNITN